MKNFKTTAAPGLFDIEFRQQWLLAKGNGAYAGQLAQKVIREFQSL